MPNQVSCGTCHRSNDSWRKHCGGCGSGLPGGCASCGTVNQATDKFCGGCAHALRAVPRVVAVGSSAGIRVRPVTQQPSHASTMPISLEDLLPDGAHLS